MGRPSKLTPEQWQTIERRLMNGEAAANLAREYGVSQANISTRFSKVPKVLETARQLADAQTALAALPVAQQYAAMSMAEKLRGISHSLASAAELGAKTAHRLHAIANEQVNKVDDATPLTDESIDAMKAVGAITKIANDSSAIAVHLISANKASLPTHDVPEDKIDASKLSSSALAEIVALRK